MLLWSATYQFETYFWHLQFLGLRLGACNCPFGAGKSANMLLSGCGAQPRYAPERTMPQYRDRAAKDIDHFLSSLLNCLNCREKYANSVEKTIKGAARLILLILRLLFYCSLFLCYLCYSSIYKEERSKTIYLQYSYRNLQYSYLRADL